MVVCRAFLGYTIVLSLNVWLSHALDKDVFQYFKVPSLPILEFNYSEDFWGNMTAGIFNRLENKIQESLDLLEEPTDTVLEYMACSISLNAYFRNPTSNWALRMMDSSSKFQSGILVGNIFDMGQYDECVEVTVDADLERKYEPFTGQHCLVQFHIYFPNNSVTINNKSVPLVDMIGYDSIPLTQAMCLPSTCPSYVLNELFNHVLYVPGTVASFFKEGYIVNTTIASTDCHLKSRGSMDSLEWIVLITISLFSFLALVSTVFDYFLIRTKDIFERRTITEKLILSFSIYSNFPKLFDTSTDRETISVLYGLKFLSLIWIGFCHRYRSLVQLPLINLIDLPKVLMQWSKMLVISGSLGVDTFLLISGLLNMYAFSIAKEDKPRFRLRGFLLEVPLMYIRRYIKVTPSYLVMVGLTATWLYRIGHGPLWDRLVGTARDDCRNAWWQNIAYLNNYFDPEHYCMMQSWFLSADMQMFWLSPPLLYTLRYWPVLGYILTLLLAAISIAVPFAISWILDVKTGVSTTIDRDQSIKITSLIYLPTHTKTECYIIGLLVGHLMYEFKTRNMRFRPSSVACFVGWLVSSLSLLYAVFGGNGIYQSGSPYYKFESAFVIGFQRFFWGFGLAWLIIACAMGYGGLVNQILSWKAFVPLSKLTHGIYLTHVAVILFDLGSTRGPTYYSIPQELQRYFGDIVISAVFATFLALIFQSPLIAIDKLIIAPLGLRRKKLYRKNARPD